MTNPKKQEKEPNARKRAAERVKAAQEYFFNSNAAAGLKRSSGIHSMDEFFLNLHSKYPGVPEMYIYRWLQNDSYLPTSGEWLDLLISTN